MNAQNANAADTPETVLPSEGVASDANPFAGPAENTPDAAPRDAEYWAQAAARINAPRRIAPRGAIPGNVNKRRLVGPLQGFGRLWQKTYQTRLSGAPVTPAEVIQVLKERLPEFQPRKTASSHLWAGLRPTKSCSSTLRLVGCRSIQACWCSIRTTNPLR